MKNNRKIRGILVIALAWAGISSLPGMAMGYDLPANGYTLREALVVAVTPQETAVVAALSTTNRQLDLQKAKELLSDMLNQLEAHFTKTREKAAALQKLTEASGVDVVKTIDSYLAQIKTLKARVADAKTSDELKQVAKEVHSLIQEAKHEVKKNIGQRVEVHIENFEQKRVEGDKLIRQAGQRIEGYKSAGTPPDLGNIDESYEDCRKLLEKGDVMLKEARTKFKKIQTMSPAQQQESARLMKEAMKTVNDARAMYGQARQECSTVTRELRRFR
jgi:hypothetical protein